MGGLWCRPACSPPLPRQKKRAEHCSTSARPYPVEAYHQESLVLYPDGEVATRQELVHAKCLIGGNFLRVLLDLLPVEWRAPLHDDVVVREYCFDPVAPLFEVVEVVYRFGDNRVALSPLHLVLQPFLNGDGDVVGELATVTVAERALRDVDVA